MRYFEIFSFPCIQEYPWAIGTSIGGEEIQNFTSTGTFSSAQNSNLTGLLMNNSTYFVSVKCTNAAGLSTLWQDEIGIYSLILMCFLYQSYINICIYFILCGEISTYAVK